MCYYYSRLRVLGPRLVSQEHKLYAMCNLLDLPLEGMSVRDRILKLNFVTSR